MTWRAAFLGYSTRGGTQPESGEIVRLMVAMRNDGCEWVRCAVDGFYAAGVGWVTGSRLAYGPVYAIAWSPAAGYVDNPLVVLEHQIETHPALVDDEARCMRPPR